MERRAERPVWAEGVLLGQQHFQAWDRYNEAAQVLRASAVSPHLWGVLSLRIDSDALALGTCRLTGCEAILPDGRLIVLDEGADGAVEVDLTGLPASGGAVHLVMPANDQAEDLPGYASGGKGAAWRPRFVEMADAHDSERSREVMLGSPNLSLRAGEPPETGAVSLKIAEVERLDDTAFRLSSRFIPTVCRIGAAPALTDLVERNLERVSARVSMLRRQQASLGRGQEFGPSEVAGFLLMQTLEPAAVALRSLRANPGSHPWQAYDVLARLVAGLRIFSQADDDTAPHDPPVYDHGDLQSVMQALDHAVDDLIGTALPQHLASIQLVRESESILQVEGVESRLLDEQTLFLAVRFDAATSMTWVDDLPRQVKIGAREELERIVASALPGVQLIHVQRPPNRLPVKTGYEYFRLDKSGEFWGRAREAGSLALYMPAAFRDARVEMVAVHEG
ncbi:type VI secretion system baseplate subunit TssK [Aquisalimonas asiatica]|uniref:Type VI secretion system protein ImpJ n=1 Tax=Aquisalimonas asiatica TaxID=406100 RepID=A0A1H8UJD4_9GAMM|nr:type VI secretion system baseplate subunit TssK [Aquisalimonas asiatica]SEP03073.1 type VI secretion system protein ImpJ [Aquisalimonas asiatica]